MINVERQKHVLLITIDRPEKRNALSLDMGRMLCDVWYQLRDDRSLRAAVLTGAGDKSFCAGADLAEIGSYYASMSASERRERGEYEPGLGGITRNLDPGKPVIAAIGGHCLAGGLELALACDIRVAARHATFGLPEVRRGIIPGAGGTQRLPRAMPLGVALELLCTGDPIDAEAALRYGLINRVVPATELLATAIELAHRIARNAPLAVQAARTAALRGLSMPLADALRIEQLYAEPVRATDDAREGVQAFVEKRDPVFRGK